MPRDREGDLVVIATRPPGWLPPGGGGEWPPERDHARDWLIQELSRAEYQEPFWAKLQRWLADVFAPSDGGLGAGLRTVVGVLFVALAVGFAATLLLRLRRERRVDEPDADNPMAVGIRSASDHRALADEAWRAGHYPRVVVHAFRSVAARAHERGLLTLTAHDTAREVADALAGAFPPEADQLREVATRFDVVRYGAGTANRPQARQALEPEERLRNAPSPGADVGPRPLAVPR